MENLRKLKKNEIPDGLYATITGRLIEYIYLWEDTIYMTPDNRLVYIDITRDGNRCYDFNEEISGRANVICKIRRKKRIFI